MPPSKPAKSSYSESEAAGALGLSVPRFRELVQTHIVESPEVPEHLSKALYAPSDLVVLRLLAKLPLEIQ